MEAVEGRERRRPATRRLVREGLQALAVATILALVVRALAIDFFYTPSGSMRPALEPGDYVLVNRVVYRLHPPRRGDIIVFHYPQNEEWDFVKRVVAIPGDMVEERGGTLRVNGALVAEPTITPEAAPPPATADVPARPIPPGRLFVLGDNRDASFDSRFWGTVDERNVIGKASLIFWSRGKRWWDVRWERIGRWLP